MSANLQMAAQLQDIELGLLHAHPQNPRLVLREDVVEGIRSQLVDAGFFSQKHAIHVRPIEGGFQTLSGHHRIEAAKRAGLKSIPCWVEDIDDEAAFMELVLANAQGELSPLERGKHALSFVELAKGGKGKKGGISDYVRRLGNIPGCSQQQLSDLVCAARVCGSIPTAQAVGLLDKAKHLTCVHRAPSATWPALVSAMLDKGWTVADTESWVAKVSEFKVDEKWAGIFLPLPLIAERFLRTKEFSPASVRRLCAEAERVEAMITEAADSVGALILRTFICHEGVKMTEYAEAAAKIDGFVMPENPWHEWLFCRMGDGSWDARKIAERGAQIENFIAAQQAVEEKEEEGPRDWNQGDWRDFVCELGNGTVASIVTDPPYGQDYQSDYKLGPARKEKRKHEKIASDATPEDAAKELHEALTELMPKLKDKASVFVFCSWRNEFHMRAAIEAAGLKLRNSLIWVKDRTGMGDPTTTFAPKHERILYAVKGSPTLFERLPDVLEAKRPDSERHPTEKPEELLKQLIGCVTVTGDLVVDPFGGVASTLAAARALGRLGWGCELNEEYHAAGEERLS